MTFVGRRDHDEEEGGLGGGTPPDAPKLVTPNPRLLQDLRCLRTPFLESEQAGSRLGKSKGHGYNGGYQADSAGHVPGHGGRHGVRKPGQAVKGLLGCG